jgi:hypothetical protein
MTEPLPTRLDALDARLREVPDTELELISRSGELPGDEFDNAFDNAFDNS